MPAPCCPPPAPLNPCPPLAQIQPTNLSVPSRRDSPGTVRGPGLVSRAGGSGRIQAAAAGLNLPASWTETLDGTAELEHEVKRTQKRAGLAAAGIPALPGLAPSPRLPHRQGHSGEGCDSEPGGQSDRRMLSPRSRQRRRQVGLLRASPARPSVEAAGHATRHPPAVWSSRGRSLIWEPGTPGPPSSRWVERG